MSAEQVMCVCVRDLLKSVSRVRKATKYFTSTVFSKREKHITRWRQKSMPCFTVLDDGGVATLCRRASRVVTLRLFEFRISFGNPSVGRKLYLACKRQSASFWLRGIQVDTTRRQFWSECKRNSKHAPPPPPLEASELPPLLKTKKCDSRKTEGQTAQRPVVNTNGPKSERRTR